jgi:hypothetical protein
MSTLSYSKALIQGLSTQPKPTVTVTVPATVTSTVPAIASKIEPDVNYVINSEGKGYPWNGLVDDYNIPSVWEGVESDIDSQILESFYDYCKRHNLSSDQSELLTYSKSYYDATQDMQFCNGIDSYEQLIRGKRPVADVLRWAQQAGCREVFTKRINSYCSLFGDYM